MRLFNVINIWIKVSILCILLISDRKVFLEPLHIHPFYLPNKKPIINFDMDKIDTLQKGRKYLDKCIASRDKIAHNYIKKPKISIIIPLYNCQKTINQSLYSVQYQNLSHFEIILINDFSKDNTSKIIKYFQENDKRIKIINNHKNMGTLYSRSVGVLISKGKYIFSLDDDDMYFDNDIFDNIYKIGENENLDIIGFLTVNLRNYKGNIKKMKSLFTYLYPDGLFIEQPELGKWMIEFKGKFLVHNNMIWDKCIKSLIYKNAVNLLGIKRYSNYISWAEDASILFVILNISKSFKLNNKYGILHFKGNTTASLTQSNYTKIFGEIFFLDIIFDFSMNNTEIKNLIVGQALYIKSKYLKTKLNNDSNSIYLRSVLNKIIKCKYLSKLNKRKLKKIFY